MGAVALLVDGTTVAPALAAATIAIEVRQVFNAPAMAVVEFADPPAGPLDGLRIGTPFTVRAGSETLIEAEITAIEHRLTGAGRTVRIRGYDRLHRLRKRQRVRALTDIAPEDLLSAAAADIGVGSEVSSNLPRRRLLIQHEQSDLDLLVEVASDCGRFVHLAGGSLRMPTLAGDGADPVRLVAGRTLLEAQVELNAETMRRSTLARGWDVTSIAPVESTVSVAAQDAVEMRGADAFSRFEGLGERLLVNRLSADQAEAEGLAQADLDRATQLGATLIATVNGDPALRPGRAVAIEGISDDADGGYVLTEATHSFTIAAGYLTRLSTLPPPRRERARTATATFARVTDANDPERLARVRVKLIAYGEIESGWMPVLIAGAGDGKGLSVIPEPDEDVLVLLPDGDPARGIVLGSLYGTRVPPGERPEEGARAFTFQTAAGQKLTLDSNEAILKLETGAGDFLEMSPKGTKLSVTRDLTVEAPGHKMTFRASRVEFERV